MKKIILFIIASLGIVSILQSQEQTVYKPFWGKDSTMQYFYVPDMWGFTIDEYPFQCTIQGANIERKEGLIPRGYFTSTNESNSKLWDISGKPWRDSILIVDMDLAIGDSFEIVRGTKNVVTNVFWKGGLKHIQFDLNFLIKAGLLNGKLGNFLHTVSYEMVEGVGSLYPEISEEWFHWYYPENMGSDQKYYGGITVRGIWRDGSPFYIHPLWEEFWNYGDIHGGASMSEVSTTNVSISCSEDDLLRIKVSNSSSQIKLGIYNLKGGDLLLTDSFYGNYERSLSSFQRGTYIVKVGEYSTKILLP